jgi:type IV pilus assembly protein PilC
MSNYAYVAVDTGGLEIRGTIDVPDQSEALRRIKEMGLFPTRVFIPKERQRRLQVRTAPARRFAIDLPFLNRVKPAVLSVFTRQLATLVEAGMPLLRGLRLLQEQESNRTLKRIIGEIAASIENGSALAEALSAHPKVFAPLYINMVKAGELGGALEVTLRRLAEFMEKARKIKGKIKSALYYPVAVLPVATGVVTLLSVFVVPQFKAVFEGLLPGQALPAFTRFVFSISSAIKDHLLLLLAAVWLPWILFLLALRTVWGRWAFDRFKLAMPILGTIFTKAAISRFTRTLGTLVSSGVPILQALTIVKETAGNAVLGKLISTVHESVKEGDPIATPLKASRLFPVMVAGMVDVGEQTGALPEMLLKVADTYDEEVDNAVNGMASLLEPIMIVFLAVIVGSIVIAMFLPLIYVAGGNQDTFRGRDN